MYLGLRMRSIKFIKTVTIVAVFLFGTLLLCNFFILNSNGKAGYTGSPGEAKCSSCHSGGTATAFGSTLLATPNFSNNEYLPDTLYTLTLTASAANFSKFGLALECLNAASANTGTLQNPSPGTFLTNAGNGRRNLTHSGPITTVNGLMQVSFKWKAPSAGSGLSNFYYCLNAVNGNNNTSGDFVFSNSLTLSEGAVVTNTTHVTTLNSNNKSFNFSNGQFQFYTLDFENLPYEFEILNLEGKRIYYKTLQSKNESLALSSILSNNGFYWVRLKCGSEIKQIQLMHLQP